MSVAVTEKRNRVCSCNAGWMVRKPFRDQEWSLAYHCKMCKAKWNHEVTWISGTEVWQWRRVA